MLRTLDSSALADYQDSVIHGGIPVPDTARSHIRELEKFNLPLLGVITWLPPGNLFIRQQAVLAALHHITGERDKAAALIRKADKALGDCIRNGFFVEGWSYLLYCKDAYTFWASVTQGDSESPFRSAFANYHALLSPEGTVATNDTRRIDARSLLADVANNETFLHPCYSVFRFPPDTFVLITHNTDLSGRRGDLHCNYDFGHFVLYSRGKWRIAHDWYEGWKAKQKNGGNAPDLRNIILNGLETREPFWRLGFAGGMSVKRPAFDRIQLDCGGTKRLFTVTSDHVDVEDEGGDGSVFNFDPQGYAEFSWTHIGDLRFDPAPPSESAMGRRRARLSGKKRSARFWF